MSVCSPGAKFVCGHAVARSMGHGMTKHHPDHCNVPPGHRDNPIPPVCGASMTRSRWDGLACNRLRACEKQRTRPRIAMTKAKPRQADAPKWSRALLQHKAARKCGAPSRITIPLSASIHNVDHRMVYMDTATRSAPRPVRKGDGGWSKRMAAVTMGAGRPPGNCEANKFHKWRRGAFAQSEPLVAQR